MISFIVHASREHHPQVRALRALCEVNTSLPQSELLSTKLLTTELFTTEWQTTKYKGHAAVLAADAARRGATHIIAVGGDGTAHEVANGIINSGERSASITMGIFPVGSGNDLVRSLGISGDPASFLRLLRSSRTRVIDVLEVRSASASGDGTPARHTCINVADTGLGGEVAALVAATPSWWNAGLRYFLCGLVGILRTQKKVMKVEWWNDRDAGDENVRQNSSESSTVRERWEGKAMSVCFANFSTFGSGIVIAPHANGSDGLIALTIIGDVSVLDYLRWMPALRAGKEIRHPQVRYAQATHIRVHSSEPASVEIDGEVVGTTPIEVTIRPGALRVLA
jgi:YegS/Rv2252/BmrU family lipid kinase